MFKLGTIGLAKSAGKIKSGDSLIDSIRKKQAKLVIIATDASDRTTKTITDKCKFYNVEYKIEFTSEELSNALGGKRVAIAILDNGFAAKLK